MPKLTADEVNIQFKLKENQLSVFIDTPRLTIRSVILDDIEPYVNLFADSEVMIKYYPEGKPFTDRLAIENDIQRWVKCWEKNDPFNGLTVFDKKSGEFIGHIALVKSNQGYGVSELVYLYHKKFWQQGIGTEAASAIVNHYAFEIRKRNYKLDGHELNKIFAKTRIDNVFSRKIIELYAKRIIRRIIIVLKFLYQETKSILETCHQQKRP
jgi:RimJ/RimL family protein N-acetyltransferase